MKIRIFCATICGLLITAPAAYSSNVRHFYDDRPFVQDFSEKIPLSEELAGTKLSAVRSDRNDRVLVLSNKGLLQVHNGQLVPDRNYRPLVDMQVKRLETYRGQFIYLTDKAVLSNAWAGRLLIPHKLPGAELFVPGSSFDFLLAGKNSLAYFNQGKCVDKWQTAGNGAKQILFDPAHNRFLLLFDDRLECFIPGRKTTTVFESNNLNCMGLIKNNTVLVIGTQDGYIELDADSFNRRSDLQKKLPCTDIHCIRQIGKSVWFGTPRGALCRGHPARDSRAGRPRHVSHPFSINSIGWQPHPDCRLSG